ncbi:ribonuclease H-like domain-containing protein [Tanacetum coccineum]
MARNPVGTDSRLLLSGLFSFINGKCERPTDDNVLRQEQWDRCSSVVLSWIFGCVTQDLYLGQIYSTNAKDAWDELEETYSKTDGEYDSLVDLPKLSGAIFLLLILFLAVLKKTYPIPDVKSAFTTLSRDKSHMNSNMHNSKSSSTTFVARSNNDWSVSHQNGTQIRSFKIPETLIINDVLVVPSYHDSFQRSLVGTGSMVGGLYYFDQGKRYANSNVKSSSMSKGLWHNRLGHPTDQVLDVLKNKLDISDVTTSPYEVCHKAKQTREPFPFSDHKTTELVYLFDNPRSNEPYDDERDQNSKDDGTKSSFVVVAEPKTYLADAEGSADPSTSTSDVDATSNDDKYEYEGEDFEHFSQLFGSDELDLNNIENDENVKRSSRRTKLPSRLDDFQLDGKVKYGLNIYKPQLIAKWVEAMNKEKEALNRNNTWVITDLPKGRRPIGSKWILRTKHFEIDLYCLREKIVEEIFKTCKIQSEFNTTDVLTKGLSSTDHKRWCDLLKLLNVFQGLALEGFYKCGGPEVNIAESLKMKVVHD